MKKVFLEISQNSQENICARVSFLIKLQAAPATLLKTRLWTDVFPWILWISKNNFFYRTPLVAASLINLAENITQNSLVVLSHSFCVGLIYVFKDFFQSRLITEIWWRASFVANQNSKNKKHLYRSLMFHLYRSRCDF